MIYTYLNIDIKHTYMNNIYHFIINIHIHTSNIYINYFIIYLLINNSR